MEISMNEEYLARARTKVDDVRLFINGVSKRAVQLAKGWRRLVPSPPNDERTCLDIALLEVAEERVIITQGDDSYASDKE
jgi:DNA-directed RNA polymerase subunit K/omega